MSEESLQRSSVPDPSPGRRSATGTESGPRLETNPRALTILQEEHKSLSAARGLAYNEAFSRASLFLTFLSMSFVALGLSAQAMGFIREFLIIAAVLLSFDLAVGVATFVRLAGAASDDLRAIHGMNRIRHGYLEIAPETAPYFTTGTNDDMPGILVTYGFVYRRRAALENFGHGLSTSQGMVGIIMALVGGVLAGVVTLLLGAAGAAAFAVAALVTTTVFIAGARWGLRDAARDRAALPVRFPTRQVGVDPGRPSSRAMG